MPRPGWDEYFLVIAKAVSHRADCSRAQHGAVLVANQRIVSTGYNGAPAGHLGCLTDSACPRASSRVASLSSYDTGPGTCIAVHAEANALLYAARTPGAYMYITGEPCAGCVKLMWGAGVLKAVWMAPYGTIRRLENTGYKA